MITDKTIVDVSTWQGNIDDDVMLSRDVIAMIIRLGSITATTGACYTDYLFYENHAKFAHEIPCGYYWYFRPKWSGKKQAEFVVKILQEENITPNLPIFLDVESNNANISMTRFASEIIAFATVITNAGYRFGIYTRGYFWNDNVGTINNASEIPLWIARYSLIAVHPWANNLLSPLRPYPWKDFCLWQWSADGNHLGKFYGCDCDSIDLNRANFETVEDFYKWANWKQDQEPAGCLPIGETLDKIIEFVQSLKEK